MDDPDGRDFGLQEQLDAVRPLDDAEAAAPPVHGVGRVRMNPPGAGELALGRPALQQQFAVECPVGYLLDVPWKRYDVC